MVPVGVATAAVVVAFAFADVAVVAVFAAVAVLAVFAAVAVLALLLLEEVRFVRIEYDSKNFFEKDNDEQ